jgi:cysteate synthase
MPKYVLRCLECGREYEDDHFRLGCDNNHSPSLLRTVYTNKRLTVYDDMPGMFKFIDFLPVERALDVTGAPMTYRSEGLAAHLGLKNLHIIFNGYWPERGAFMHTASFKELEAPSVLARIPEDHKGTIVVASAGNTGRAFANICSQNGIPLILTIPEKGICEIWSIQPFDDCVKVIVAGGNSDYFDAITLASKIIEIDGFFPEGGAFNVARREGMATTLLDAAHVIGRIPDHYFQAVGSGTGGIAAWESYLRLREDGRYGKWKMKLHLAQNYPFIPMTEAWNRGERNLPPISEKKAKEEINQIRARVLSNRKPPYSIRGGVFDVLSESSGFMYSVTNEEVDRAMELFERYENSDIHPASGVALGALIQAVSMKRVKSNDVIVLNVTGGGEKKIRRDYDLHYIEPFERLTDTEIHSEDAIRKIESILAAV